MTFQLDTSGAVLTPLPNEGGSCMHIAWLDLDPFTQGYVEALFAEWADSLNEQGQVLLSWRRGVDRVAFSDLAPETLAAILKDCAAAKAEAGAAFENTRDAGAEFWADRQAGAWPLRFPPLTPYLGNDGKVRLREAA